MDEMKRKDNLFKKAISEDNLIRAWDLVRHDAENDFATDVLKYSDFGHNIGVNLKAIHQQLSFDNYQPMPLKYIDVPKSTLAVRPGSVPEIEDRIVSYAVINIIAPIIDEQISENVYSFRVRRNYKKSKSSIFHTRKDIPFLKKKTIRKMIIFEDWFYGWPMYYEISKYLYEKENYRFLAVSDISSYYENINHNILRDHLFSLLPNEQKIINLLMTLLERWAWKSRSLVQLGRGIPQGNEVASFLGNIYLMPLDDIFEEYAKKKDIKYMRYMDDVKIFSKSEDIARDVLFGMNNALRDLHLNVQGSKTQILRHEEIKKELGISADMDQLNDTLGKIDKAISKAKKQRTGIAKKQISQFEKELREAYNKVSRKKTWDKNDRRLFHRSLTGFNIIKSKAAINRCLREIKVSPDDRTTEKVTKYLRLFPNEKRIFRDVSDFLLSDINKFEYQEAHLVLLFKHLNTIPDELLEYMKKVAFDDGKHWFSRSAALTTLANTRLDRNMLNKLRNLYENESNADIKKAISLCLLQQDSTNLIKFVREMSMEIDPHISRIGNYFNAVIYNEKNLAQKELSMMSKFDPSSEFFKKHFYIFFLLKEVQNRKIKRDLANILKKKHNEMDDCPLRTHIQNIYKEITNVELE